MELYKLSNQYFELEDMDLTSDELLAKLESLDGEFDAKADSICHVLANMAYQTDNILDEVTRLTKRGKTFVARQEKLREYLVVNMERLGKKKIESAKFTISCVAGRDKVNITDEDLIPEAFREAVISIKIDKRYLLEELKTGKVEGAELIKSKPSIRIK